MIHCSMKSLDIGEDECDSPDEGQANNLRDSMQVSLYSTSLFSVLTLNLSLNVRCFIFFLTPSIEMDDFIQDPGNLDLEDGYSSDEEFVPSLYLRYIFLFTTRNPSNSIKQVP